MSAGGGSKEDHGGRTTDFYALYLAQLIHDLKAGPYSWEQKGVLDGCGDLNLRKMIRSVDDLVRLLSAIRGPDNYQRVLNAVGYECLGGMIESAEHLIQVLPKVNKLEILNVVGDDRLREMIDSLDHLVGVVGILRFSDSSQKKVLDAVGGDRLREMIGSVDHLVQVLPVASECQGRVLDAVGDDRLREMIASVDHLVQVLPVAGGAVRRLLDVVGTDRLREMIQSVDHLIAVRRVTGRAAGRLLDVVGTDRLREMIGSVDRLVQLLDVSSYSNREKIVNAIGADRLRELIESVSFGDLPRCLRLLYSRTCSDQELTELQHPLEDKIDSADAFVQVMSPIIGFVSDYDTDFQKKALAVGMRLAQRLDSVDELLRVLSVYQKDKGGRGRILQAVGDDRLRKMIESLDHLVQVLDVAPEYNQEDPHYQLGKKKVLNAVGNDRLGEMIKSVDHLVQVLPVASGWQGRVLDVVGDDRLREMIASVDHLIAVLRFSGFSQKKVLDVVGDDRLREMIGSGKHLVEALEVSGSQKIRVWNAVSDHLKEPILDEDWFKIFPHLESFEWNARPIFNSVRDRLGGMVKSIDQLDILSKSFSKFLGTDSRRAIGTALRNRLDKMIRSDQDFNRFFNFVNSKDWSEELISVDTLYIVLSLISSSAPNTQKRVLAAVGDDRLQGFINSETNLNRILSVLAEPAKRRLLVTKNWEKNFDIQGWLTKYSSTVGDSSNYLKLLNVLWAENPSFRESVLNKRKNLEFLLRNKSSFSPKVRESLCMGKILLTLCELSEEYGHKSSDKVVAAKKEVCDFLKNRIEILVGQLVEKREKDAAPNFEETIREINEKLKSLEENPELKEIIFKGFNSRLASVIREIQGSPGWELSSKKSVQSVSMLSNPGGGEKGSSANHSQILPVPKQ